jgi:hypothetical protein
MYIGIFKYSNTPWNPVFRRDLKSLVPHPSPLSTAPG